MQGHLLGQPATNIAEIWNLERDWIEQVVDGYMDEGEISLKNEESALHILSINQQQTQESQYGEETMFHPTKGFAGYTPAVIRSRDIPKSMQIALNCLNNCL